jgi:dienelactone hydrolase
MKADYKVARNFVWMALVVLPALFIQKACAQTDPFAPYLNSVPAVIRTLSKADSSDGSSVITISKFIFSSRDNSNAVYAIMARPQKAGRYPAILFLHGGGSRAEDLYGRVVEYAKRGYVTISIDQPGICNSVRAVNSDGPWKTKPQGEAPRFDMSGGPQNSTLADAEIAGLETFNLLSSQPDVDPKNMGITGFSWGGYSTTLLAGLLGNRVKAAYAVFGCGFYDLGSFWKDMIAKMPETDRAVWLRYLDAGRRAANIKAAYFLDEASNDTFFWPEAVDATLNQIRKNKNHVWGPNLNHKQSIYGAGMQRHFFDHYLKRIGLPFGKIMITKINVEIDGSRKVCIKTDLPKGIAKDSILLYFSEQNVNWQAREWKPVNAIPEKGNKYYAILPADAIKNGINFYAYLRDERGVTTSSSMYESNKKP